MEMEMDVATPVRPGCAANQFPTQPFIARSEASAPIRQELTLARHGAKPQVDIAHHRLQPDHLRTSQRQRSTSSRPDAAQRRLRHCPPPLAAIPT